MRTAIRTCGDAAVKVVIDDHDPELCWRAAHRLAAQVNDGDTHGLTGAIATYDSVLVEFDPLALLPDEAVQEVGVAFGAVDPFAAWLPGATFEIPVVYGGEHGPDLDAVARHLGLEAADVVAAHAATEHVVRCYSHSATAMLDAPDLPGEIPRLADPRVVVPAGSVTLAGRQAVILACTQASGWQIIGRTPVRLTNLSAPTITSYRPGDLFRYRQIDATDWDRWSGTTMESCRV